MTSAFSSANTNDRGIASRAERVRRRGGGEPTKGIRPEFLDLIAESRDRPACELAPIIRRSLLEHRFVGVGDDAADQSPAEIDQAVDELVEALESVRLAHLQDGTWSSAPVPPLMCG